MIEPLLQCQICRHCYPERYAQVARVGRWAGQLIGPVHCYHPLTFAYYVHPTTHAPLVAYGTPEPERWAMLPQAVQRWQQAGAPAVLPGRMAREGRG